ncbi:putative zinc finger protein [Trypanosoma rangeli]|uniref:Putative zinc finger protein n=1 Tax=Trypanosoma rangeli TaxID=5698 RepID=A0A3S5IRP0_TRYRA|nr:putative zinc finger protein [Trypanosoma rangeli]RNF07924.1 putative zinc finger protein [Trypanosoma rangeli]|eukprot:RNF07924.1 putative zinc finger protein [Trypanosoma rangeli]
MGTSNSKGAHWQRDSEAPSCHRCAVTFSLSTRRHHCRNCGYVFCRNCSNFSCTIPTRGAHLSVRVCIDCFHILRKDGNGAFVAGGLSRGSESIHSGMGERNEASFLEHESHLNMSTTWNEEVNHEDSYFMGPGGWVTKNADGGFKGSDAYYGNHSRAVEHLTHTRVEDDKMVSQVEKERLVNRWEEVRQRALFTDILLQQVEIVEENTDVDYFREIGDIKVQPEHPDILTAMFQFPEAEEGNANLLMEPVDPRILEPQGGCECVSEDLGQLATLLFLPPAKLIKKSDSRLLRQC